MKNIEIFYRSFTDLPSNYSDFTGKLIFTKPFTEFMPNDNADFFQSKVKPIGTMVTHPQVTQDIRTGPKRGSLRAFGGIWTKLPHEPGPSAM